MRIRSLFLRGRSSRSSVRTNASDAIAPRRRALRLEPLEDRRVLSTLLMVDADAMPGGDGLTWDSAYDDLQVALSQATALNTDADVTNNITSIWIAEGTYKPSALLEADDARSASFSLADDLTLYGGFEGTETTLEARDWAAHVTTLSGDLGTPDNNSDNAHSVVYCGWGSNAGVDGVLITGGHATAVFSAKGGGIYNAGVLAVANSTISNNFARDCGGGVYNIGKLIVTNSTISDNLTTNDGGGIYSKGKTTVVNSTFSGNLAYDGGGIFRETGRLIVMDSTFSENHAAHCSGGIFSCSGIDILTIANSIFLSNSAKSGAGGIYSGKGTLAITDSTFSGNSAVYDGGGIYSAGGTLTVTNSTLSANSGNCGGGIYSAGGTLTVTNSTLSANSTNSSDGGGGGGIYNSKGTLTITNSTLSANSAGSIDDYDYNRYGGGIYNSNGTLIVISSTISDNFACGIGGGIYSNTGTVTITGSTVSDNSTYKSGGGIYSRFGTLTVLYSTLSNNSAEQDGGGIYYYTGLSASGITVMNSTIADNSTERNGGGIYNGQGDLIVTDSTISGNSGYDGGGIYDISGVSTVTGSTIFDNSGYHGGGIYTRSGTLTVTNAMISNNSARTGGGIYSDAGTVTITSSTLSDNAAGTGGGIYHLNGPLTLTVNNTIVAGNIASSAPDIDIDFETWAGSHNLIGDGSDQLIFVDGVDGNQVGTASSPLDPLLSHWTQLDNGQWGYRLLPGSPAADAGNNELALDLSGQPLTEDASGNARIQNGTVDIGAVEGTALDNEAQTYMVTSLEKTIAADGILTFIEAFEAANRNQPVGDALGGSFVEQDIIQFNDGLSGTVLLDDGELTVFGDLNIEGPGADRLTFDADGRNRVFSIKPNRHVSLAGMTITGGYDSGIYNEGILAVSDSTLADNVGVSGGGICNSRGALSVTNSAFFENRATGTNGRGGGIYSTGNHQLTIANSTFTDNSAKYDGGGIATGSGSLTVTNSMLSGNSAIHVGGGILAGGRELTVVNSTLLNNLAGEDGGGIFSTGNHQLTIANSTIIGNSAGQNGGGFCGLGVATLTVTNSTLANNSASNCGGGIYSHCWSTVADSAFAGNSAGYDGGGIYSSFMLGVADSTFTDNSAGGDGGGVYGCFVLDVTGTTFTCNSSAFGGGIYQSKGKLTIVSSTLSGNSAIYGGGIFGYNSAIITVASSIFSGNLARYGGGGIHGDSTLTITSSTFSGNSAKFGGGISKYRSTLILTNSIVALNENGDVDGVLSDECVFNLIGIDPGFVRNPSDGGDGWGDNPDTPDIDESANDDYGDLRLRDDSPAIDAGNTALLLDDTLDLDGDSNVNEPIPYDIANNSRVMGSSVDIGAWEHLDGVVARHVFYNNSMFDGDDATANAEDDAAIAIDKRALLPGETATLTNYTSYVRGINGIMIDVAKLGNTSELTAADFTFRVGNSNDTTSWTIAPTPTDVAVRLDAGLSGSDRVTIVWPDGELAGEWLQVTMLANETTGLTEPDIFYFGNAIGEAGNTPTDAKVNAADMLSVRDNPQGFLDPAPIDSRYDFDRDARVDAIDMLIARDNTTHVLNVLNLITAPSVEMISNAKGSDIAATHFTKATAAIAKAPLHDAVMQQAISRESRSFHEPSAIDLAWLYQLEETSRRESTPKTGIAAKEAVAVFSSIAIDE